MLKSLDDYIEYVQQLDDVEKLRAELIERVRVNVGLITENLALNARVRQLEEGKK